uniref:Uncharacterized protein n=1 Tax=Tetradesmus obliquus TaxID=3088 RepID=A0A383VL83_TETOB|eukprot:jgi/Sobl393_1/17217/SZX65146.1
MALRCQPFSSNALSTAKRARFIRQTLYLWPQASSSSSNRPVPLHSVASAAAQQQDPASLRISQLAVLRATPAALLYALPAFAAEDFSVDAAYEAVQQQSAGSTDLVVSVLAVTVFALLVVVTGGVAYLALKSWLDERQEKQDKEYRPLVTRAPAAATSSFEEKEEKRRVREKREKKGFGSKV